MSATDSDETFVCPECRREIPVDPPKKHALLRFGCAVCGANLTTETFDGGSPTVPPFESTKDGSI